MMQRSHSAEGFALVSQSGRVETMRSLGSLHILHVVPGLSPGGMELGMAKVIRGLNGEQMRHTVVALKDEPQIAGLMPGETEIHCLHAEPNELRLPMRLAAVIRSAKPTVIHARNWGAWPDTVAASLLVRPRPSVILSFHGLGKAGYMPLRRRAASWALARMCSTLFAVSNQSKELMVSKWGWPRDKTQVISNGVDTERFAPRIESPTGSRPVVGTVGNLRPVKNQALLVRACAEIVQEGQDLEVHIAGEGEERDALANLAAQTGLGDRLKLVGRIDDVPAFLHRLDVFVLPSDSEQHPNALNEAMACGLACVATRVGCAEELLDQGQCGIIVPPGKHLEMTAAIQELIQNPSARKQYGQAARRMACDHYSLRRMLNSYETLYRHCSIAAHRS